MPETMKLQVILFGKDLETIKTSTEQIKQEWDFDLSYFTGHDEMDRKLKKLVKKEVPVLAFLLIPEIYNKNDPSDFSLSLKKALRCFVWIN